MGFSVGKSGIIAVFLGRHSKNLPLNPEQIFSFPAEKTDEREVQQIAPLFYTWLLVDATAAFFYQRRHALLIRQGV